MLSATVTSKRSWLSVGFWSTIGLCCKKEKENKMSREWLILFSLGKHSKQLGNQCNLTWDVSFVHPLHLSLPDHVHGLESLQCSPCSQIREEAHSRFRQAFDEAMILFNQIVEVCAPV